MREKFWCFKRPSALKPMAEWDDGKVRLEHIRCALNEGHRYGGRRLDNLSVVLSKHSVEDFVWTYFNECLMQDATLKVLRMQGFSGFEVKPVAARFKKSRKNPPQLWELIVTGWAGGANPESGIHLDEARSCVVCMMLQYTGLSHPERLIDERKWDGSDFFMVWPLPRIVFITDRVAQFIRDRQLTGVQIESLSELQPTDGYSPGRLSYWMPDIRARELGEALGIY